MTEWQERSCAEFARALASSAPTPGGGGAAAMTGALASALCAMAARLTAGRKKYADLSPRLDAIAARADELRLRLLTLIAEDAEGFEPLLRVYALPKEEANRAQRLQEASMRACEAPMEMLRCSEAALELLEEAEGLVSPMLLSDVGCGAALARAALESAAMNVQVNARQFPGEAEAEQLMAEVRRARAELLPRAEALAAAVAARLEKE